ncbi:MAG TPA: hypothetical protein GXX46_04550 [Peptococcaceae bacterium]|nr:hypothetical protein [Peptococcaceae bacterium]
MIMIILLLLAFWGIVLYEVPNFIRSQHWRELKVFFVLLGIAFIITLLQTIGVKLPSPVKLLTYLIRDILQLNYE